MGYRASKRLALLIDCRALLFEYRALLIECRDEGS